MQAGRAANAIDSGEGCLVPLSVSLVLEWVLRGAYRLGMDLVVRAFEGLLSVRRLHYEQDSMVLEALQRHPQGLDFADAPHHLAAAECVAKLSFDGTLITGVERLGLEPVARAPCGEASWHELKAPGADLNRSGESLTRSSLA